MADRFSQEVLEVVKAASSAATRISQEVLEVVRKDSGTSVRMSQEVLEVVLGPPTPAPVGACPVNNQATLGLPYEGQVIVTGGTPPDTFEIV